MNILVLDTETTGLDIIRHEIIEIAFVNFILENSKVQIKNKISLKISPQHIELADDRALKINGYDPKKWTNSKPIVNYLPTISKLIEHTDILLGQNLIFDLRFLKKSFEEYSLPVPKFPKYIDTKMMGSKLVKEGLMNSSSMDKMCEHFQIKFEGRAHTALTDCERTILVFEKLLEQNSPIQYFSFKQPYDYHNANKKNNG